MSYTLLLFRNNLRVSDNKALTKAIEIGQPILPVVCLNTMAWKKRWFYLDSMGVFRQQFLMACIQNLETHLRTIGLSLHVHSGTPIDTVRHYNRQKKPSHIITNIVLGAYETYDQYMLTEWCSDHAIPIGLCWDSTLIDIQQLPIPIHNLPNQFSSFRKLVEQHCTFQAPKPRPKSAAIQATNLHPELTTIEPYRSTIRLAHSGGETAAQRHLNDYIWTTKAIRHYKQTRNKSIGTHTSTHFSIWLSHGCLSPRIIVEQVQQFEQTVVKNISTYWVIFELLWRDFFHFQCLKHGVKWYSLNGIQNKKPPSSHNQHQLKKWLTGQTGCAFIDAHMRELVQTGFMSNRGRQNCASYLIHTLQLDWRLGAEVFEHYLIDYDVASNIGNWMYIAGVGNSNRPTIFNPIKQSQTHEPTGAFIKKWVPECVVNNTIQQHYDPTTSSPSNPHCTGH